MISNVKETKEFIESKIGGFKADAALVVGSGLGGISAALSKPITIPYADIPHFPQVTVAGHSGQMVFGEWAGHKLMLLNGRFHFYEGRTLAEVVYPIHVIDALGIKTLIVTNAAGGINPQYNPGDLMIIEDHINFMGVNPLVGMAENGSIKFVDMGQAYSTRLSQKLQTAAQKMDLPIWRGVHLATPGPNYETPAAANSVAGHVPRAVGTSTWA